MDSQDTSGSGYLYGSEPEDNFYSDAGPELNRDTPCSSGGSPLYSDCQNEQGQFALEHPLDYHPLENDHMEKNDLSDAHPSSQGIRQGFHDDLDEEYPSQPSMERSRDTGKRSFDDYEPNINSGRKRSAHSGMPGSQLKGNLTPKACNECGATKTPQWREGPDGPKTLCNACGVRLNRQGKTKHDSGRRRKYELGQGPKPVSETEYLGRMYAQTFEDEVMHRGLGPNVPRDPQMLFKTEREAHPSHQFKWGPHSGVEYGMGSHGSDDGASHGGHVHSPLESDVAEDMSMAWAAGSRPLSAEASERIVGGLAARSAAPDLLAEERFEMRPEPSPRPVLQEAPRLEHTDAHFQGSASAALFQRDSATAIDYASLEAVRRMHCELSGEAECTLHEVALANAAISAVAKILAVRQAEAITAHLEVESATQRLRAFEEMLRQKTVEMGKRQMSTSPMQ